MATRGDSEPFQDGCYGSMKVTTPDRLSVFATERAIIPRRESARQSASCAEGISGAREMFLAAGESQLHFPSTVVPQEDSVQRVPDPN